MGGNIYKEIKGFPGYHVNSNGDVISFRRYGKITDKALLMKTYVSNSGYLCVKLRNNNIVHTCTIHRLIASSFVPNRHNKPHINHINGNKLDNSVENLEWCTPSENIIHAIKTMGHYIGKNNGMSVLNSEKVLEIRRLLASKVPQRKIAKMFGVTKGAIGCIKSGITWKHVQQK